MRTKAVNLRTNVIEVITERSKQGLWTSQETLIDNLDVTITSRTLRRIIRDIRDDADNNFIILTDYVKGYKLMTKEDKVEELLKRKIAILKSLKLFYKDVKRLNSHNAYKLKLENDEIEIIKTLIEEMR